MANMNVRTPRFYTDYINYFLSRGEAQDGSFDVLATNAGAYKIGLQTGTESELFDMRPLNKVDFDTSSDTDGHVIVTLNLKSSYKKSFVAILNHNLVSAAGKIRISAGNILSDVQAVDGADAETADINWGSVTVTEIVNADTITAGADNKSVVIEPALDGTTLFTFDESDMQYWGIQFEGNTTNTGNATNGTWGSTDLYVGGIMVGEYYDMPHSPDLSAKRSIVFDKVKQLESIGGQRFSNMTSYGRVGTIAGGRSPFNIANYNFTAFGGRLAYDLNFSYLNSTDLMPDEYQNAFSMASDDSVVVDIWNITHGSHIPFIFSIDKDSKGDGAESEHIFARFAQNSLDMTQVANDIWNVKMRIEEEF